MEIRFETYRVENIFKKESNMFLFVKNHVFLKMFEFSKFSISKKQIVLIFFENI